MKLKEENFNITKACWNNMEKIEEEKVQNLMYVFQYVKELKKLLNKFSQSYKDLNFENDILEFKESNWNEFLKFLDKYVRHFIITLETLLTNIKDKFKESSVVIDELEKKYKSLSSVFTSYKGIKEKLDKIKGLYMDKMEKFENIVMNNIKNKDINIINLNKSDKKLLTGIANDYNSFVKESSNKVKKDAEDGKKLIFDYYNKILVDEPLIYKGAFSNSIYATKDFISYYTTALNNLNVMRQDFNEKEYKRKVIELYQNNTDDKEYTDLSYNIKYNPYIIFKTKDKNKIQEAINLREDLIKNMKKIMKNYHPNVDLDIQETSVQLPNIINDYLEVKTELTDTNKKQILDYIKNDYSIYPQIMILLNRYRSNSKLYYSKEHIIFLSEIFEEVLKISQELLDYSSAKNCIILSQTYFYVDEKTKKKIYLIEQIKENKWITSEEFWSDFINNQITKEIKKFAELKNISVSFDGEINIPKDYSGKIGEIIFASLITYISNMKDFNLKIEQIDKIMKKLVEKYNCLGENKTKELFMILSSNPEDNQNISIG